MKAIAVQVMDHPIPRHASCCQYLTFLLLLAVLLIPHPVQAAQDQGDTKANLERLRLRIQALKQTLEKARGKKSTVQKELQRVESDISETARTLRKLQGEIRQQKKSLVSLGREREQLRESLGRQQHLLAGQVRASYAMGRQEQIKIVLNQGDPSTVQRALVYYDYLNRSRTRRIHAVTREIKKLQEVEARISHEQSRLETLLAQQTRRQEELQGQRKQRRKLLVAITSEIRTQDQKLDRMLQDEKELQRVLNAVEQALTDIPVNLLNRKSLRSRKGALPWPTEGKISAKFNGLRSVQANLRWSGVRIDAESGRDVRAISHGRVAFADWLRGYGLMLIIDHGDGFMSLYGHNQSLYKEPGEWVNEGDVIASVGNSGGQSRSSLYFEIRKDGKPVNPTLWCRRTRHGLVGLNP